MNRHLWMKFILNRLITQRTSENEFNGCTLPALLDALLDTLHLIDSIRIDSDRLYRNPKDRLFQIDSDLTRESPLLLPLNTAH